MSSQPREMTPEEQQRLNERIQQNANATINKISGLSVALSAVMILIELPPVIFGDAHVLDAFYSIVITPGAILLWYWTRNNKLTRERSFALVFALCSMPLLRVLVSVFVAGQSAANFIYAPDTLIWLAMLPASGLFLERWFPLSVAFWAASQYICIFLLARPDLLTLSGPESIIDTLIAYKPAFMRVVIILTAGVFVAYTENLLRRFLTELQQEERMRGDEELARKLAERSNHAKSMFMAHMNHELRTPLNAILGYTQILQGRDDLSPKQAEGLKIIEGSGRHLRSLIDDVLDMSKIEAHRMELAPTTVHLGDFFEGVVKSLQSRAQTKGLEFVSHVDENLPEWIRVDEKRLKQVLLNLLGNAIKFTQKGQVTLNITKISETDDSDEVSVSFAVEDTGPGIAADQLEAIFDPFTQAGDPLMRHAGTGLGLAISKELVELMGGTLHVSSTLGTGSRFWFELSLPSAQADNSNTRPQLVIGYHGQRKRVLVVDDEVFNRRVLRDMLTPLGFEVEEACDGIEALEVIENNPPDLVLIDFLMPRLNGVETISRLRKSEPEGQRMPVVAVTANSMVVKREQWEEDLFDQIIHKPVLLHMLIKAIYNTLGLEWVARNEPQRRKSPTTSELSVTAHIDPALLVEFHELASAGNLFELEAALGKLSQDTPEAAALIGRLRAMIDNFDDSAILSTLERMMSQNPRPPS